ncbi:MAG: hypothetical protein CMO61_00475 [Verrucomicrobiales bacterium]|jgi:hypothetical protein|nr:hypothetical protein [Verrucomicrobiales bacterium]
MKRLSYREFHSGPVGFDAAVSAQGEIAKFCSSSIWISAANEFLHAGDSNREPEYCIVEDDGNWLVMVDRGGRGIWFPLESAWMFGCPLIGEPEVCVDMLKRHGSEMSGSAGFCIGGVRNERELHRRLRKLGLASSRYEEFPATDCMVIELEDGYQSWLGRRSKKFQKSVRQLPSEDGIEIVDGSKDDVNFLFRRVIAIQKQTYKWQEGTDIFQGNDYLMFYRHLLERLSQSGRLRILFARKDKEDIAYILGAEFANQYRGLQMSYVAGVKSSAIGNRLQLENIQRCVEAGLEEYDLGMYSTYKERWADRQDEYLAAFVVL